jgi:hypothetical protein
MTDIEKTCDEHASYRYTWPGRDESFICAQCAERLRRIADAMGLYLQLIPLMPGTETCQQKRRAARSLADLPREEMR